ncbi:MAG TPA: hypothetical protein VF210_14780 [Pseudomonadales bacterium]
MPDLLRGLAFTTALLAALPAAGDGAASFDITPCENLLGNNYDSLEPAAKAARLSAFGGCWKRRADAAVRHNYRTVLSRVDNFHFYGKRQAHEQISAKAATANNVLRVRQRTEQDSLRQRFDSEFRALAMNPGDDPREMNKRKGEINQRRKAEQAALQARHRQEREELQRSISQSYLTVDEKLASEVHDDKLNLARQRIAVEKEIERLHGLAVNPEGRLGDGEAAMIGRIQEVEGRVTITGTDGQSMTARVGTPVFHGDVIETGIDGAANIAFIDETAFALSEDSRLVVDEYVYDPSSEPTSSDYSFLKAIFVFTSGLLGRGDIQVDTPIGAIGIRG